jgi:MoxR-like ATPase
MAIPILSHRLMLKSSVNMFKSKSEEIVQELLNTVQAPLEKL